MIREYSKSDRSKGLSANFAVGEFGCRCTRCKTILVDEGLVERLQQVRDHFDKAVVITSGYRCEAHNAEVSGAAGSRHTKGQAADFYIPGVAPAEIAKFAESIGIKGIGLYDDFVHIDTREKKSFWYGHNSAVHPSRPLQWSFPRSSGEARAVKSVRCRLSCWGMAIRSMWMASTALPQRTL